MRPLALWCAEQQHRLLKKGMLPFNGDETYIAGGLLPRSAIHHGSMEATALYHAACLRMLRYADEWKLDAAHRELLEGDRWRIEENFTRNFVGEGLLLCNNPDYCAPGEEPPMYIGVRLCGHGFGLCLRNRFGDYVCPACHRKLERPLEGPDRRARYRVPAALMMPAFIGTELIDGRIIEKEMRRMAEGLLRGGEGKTVGYDAGLALYALGGKDDRLRRTLTELLLSRRDAAGAWVEYYQDGLPSGTMCRPWESAINMAAILKHAR